ncbi:hypothetical protein RU98_GL002622 [Enterococcus caccae]|nr:hypothetical protein RU98_GL002622 [Enterococcus caccae]
MKINNQLFSLETKNKAKSAEKSTLLALPRVLMHYLPQNSLSF